jgi:hypothetical protein
MGCGDGIVIRQRGALIECVGTGRVTRIHVVSAQRMFESIYESDGRRFDRLFDGVGIESFEPGLPWLWIRWSLQFHDRNGQVAVVGRPGPMISVAGTFRYLLPRARIGVFTNRSAALNFLGHADDSAA